MNAARRPTPLSCSGVPATLAPAAKVWSSSVMGAGVSAAFALGSSTKAASAIRATPSRPCTRALAPATARRAGWRHGSWNILFSLQAARGEASAVQRAEGRRGRQRPLYVLREQRASIGEACAQRGLDGGTRLARVQCVAERHGEVALPARMADAPDGRPLGAPQELVFAPCEQVQQRRMGKLGA